MSTRTMTAMFAAMLALSAPALAQTAGTAPRTTTGTMAHQMRPDDIRASKFIGATVYDSKDQNIGKINDVIFNREGRIDAAVIDVGSFLGMGGKLVTVSLNDLRISNDRLMLDRTKEQLQSAQAFSWPSTNSIGMATGTTGSGSTAPPRNR